MGQSESYSSRLEAANAHLKEKKFVFSCRNLDFNPITCGINPKRLINAVVILEYLKLEEFKQCYEVLKKLYNNRYIFLAYQYMREDDPECMYCTNTIKFGDLVEKHQDLIGYDSTLVFYVYGNSLKNLLGKYITVLIRDHNAKIHQKEQLKTKSTIDYLKAITSEEKKDIAIVRGAVQHNTVDAVEPHAERQIGFLTEIDEPDRLMTNKELHEHCDCDCDQKSAK